MTILKQTAFTGAAGASPATANTGFDSFTNFGSFKFVSSPAINSLVAIPVGSSSTHKSSSGLFSFSPQLSESYARGYHYQSALNNSGNTAPIVSAAASGIGFELDVTTGVSNQFYLYRTDNGSALWTSTTTISVNTWYRVELHHASSANSIQVRIYSANSATPLEDSGVVTVSGSIGTVSAYSFGGANWMDAYLGDGNAIGDGAGGWLGPASASFTASGSLTLGATGAMRAPLTGTGLLSLAASGTAVAAPGAIHGTAAITLGSSGTTKATVTGGAALSLSGVASGITSHTNVAGTGIVSLAASGLITVKTTAHALLTLAAAAILAVYRDIQVSVIYGKDRWSVMSAGVMTVEVTAGGREFAWGGLTEVNGSDISADTVQVSLGSQLKSGTWNTPDSVSFPIPSQVIAKKLIDNTVAPGTYWLWIKLADTPETVVRSSTQVIVH